MQVSSGTKEWANSLKRAIPATVTTCHSMVFSWLERVPDAFHGLRAYRPMCPKRAAAACIETDVPVAKKRADETGLMLCSSVCLFWQ
ncbi:hypothetical protein TNCV_4361901 [Trichonephila clavipes]|nr:hypothetical protein TNCV_4361901 [Trichonephila clavipes]